MRSHAGNAVVSKPQVWTRRAPQVVELRPAVACRLNAGSTKTRYSTAIDPANSWRIALTGPLRIRQTAPSCVAEKSELRRERATTSSSLRRPKSVQLQARHELAHANGNPSRRDRRRGRARVLGDDMPRSRRSSIQLADRARGGLERHADTHAKKCAAASHASALL